MSWHFLQGQEEASWAESSLDGAPSALLNLLNTQDGCYSLGSGTDCCQPSQYGMTCEPSMGCRGEDGLMLSAAASRARTSVAQEKELAYPGVNPRACRRSVSLLRQAHLLVRDAA